MTPLHRHVTSHSQDESAVFPILVGLDHRSATLDLRERLYVDGASLIALLQTLNQEPLAEAVVLSTCNRLEVYAIGHELEPTTDAIIERIATLRDVSFDRLSASLYVQTGPDVARHLFRVAAGLESLVLGEPQIQGQVANALRAGQDARTTGPGLSRVFSHALHAGKRARNETGISHHTLSVSHAAARLVERELGSLAGRRVTLIGAGEMAALAIQALRARGATDLLVISRTHEKAQALAERHHARALPWALWSQELPYTDAIVIATRAPHFVLHRDDFASESTRLQGIATPDSSPPIVIDISVPRAVDPAVRGIAGMRLYDIDDLQAVVENHQRLRRSDVERVERIVEVELTSYLTWVQSRQVVPLISSLRQQAEEIAQAELARALRRAPELDDRERAIMAQLAHRIVNKVLHAPTIALKARAGRGEHVDYVHATRKLFALDEPESRAENGAADE